MIHGDIADVAAEYEQREGIPQARVEAVQAVRCVGCAEVKERGRRLARKRGGITCYPESGA